MELNNSGIMLFYDSSRFYGEWGNLALSTQAETWNDKKPEHILHSLVSCLRLKSLNNGEK